MAAAGTSPALNLREKLAELAGLKQRVSPDLVRCDFGNLVTNGTFDTDTTGWTAGNSAVLSHDAGGNRALLTNGVVSSNGYMYQDIPAAVRGRLYTITATMAVGTNSLPRIHAGTNGLSLDRLADYGMLGQGVGTFTSVFTPTTTTAVGMAQNNVTNSVTSYLDNVSLYEADPSDDAPWLRLPYGYKVGQRGMIVRDGVVLHPSDYTEITDSGQTWIKPIVAPGASTEFSIWAGA